jgi:hypothetical protein
LDQTDNDIVGHEISGIHEALRLEPERCSVANGVSQDIPGRVLGNTTAVR